MSAYAIVGQEIAQAVAACGTTPGPPPPAGGGLVEGSQPPAGRPGGHKLRGARGEGSRATGGCRLGPSAPRWRRSRGKDRGSLAAGQRPPPDLAAGLPPQ